MQVDARMGSVTRAARSVGDDASSSVIEPQRPPHSSLATRRGRVLATAPQGRCRSWQRRRASVWIAATVGASYARIMVGYIESCGSGARDDERCTDGTMLRARSCACRDAWSRARTTREALRVAGD